MGARTLYGSGFKTPSAISLPDRIAAEGRLRAMGANFALLNGDDANNKCYIGKVPSYAVPFKGAASLTHSALTGLTDVDIGLERDGTTVSVDCFADGLTLASAGTKDPFANVTAANVGKPIWQLLGLSVDPGVEYDVVMTLKVASGANGNAAPQLAFIV